MDTTFLQQAFSDSQVLTVPWSIDYFSVVVGVLTGALFACDRKLDIIGTVSTCESENACCRNVVSIRPFRNLRL